MSNETERIKINSPEPLSFSVHEYVELVQREGYKQSYMDFNFLGLLEDLPKVTKSFGNDILAKAILSHSYGEMLAKNFRDWIRSQLDESEELDCGGASISEGQEGWL